MRYARRPVVYRYVRTYKQRYVTRKVSTQSGVEMNNYEVRKWLSAREHAGLLITVPKDQPIIGIFCNFHQSPTRLVSFFVSHNFFSGNQSIGIELFNPFLPPSTSFISPATNHERCSQSRPPVSSDFAFHFVLLPQAITTNTCRESFAGTFCFSDKCRINQRSSLKQHTQPFAYCCVISFFPIIETASPSMASLVATRARSHSPLLRSTATRCRVSPRSR